MDLLMTPDDDQTLRTSWTLVARLKDVGDEGAWREFYDLYCRLVRGVALRAGLEREEAEEVVQETTASVSKHIQEFEADPARGSFRSWLLQMARRRISDQFQKRLPISTSSGESATGTARTATIERVPESRQVDLEGLCDAEWQERLREEALKRLQLEVKAEHYQIFYLLAMERKPPLEVARMLGRSRAEVYVVKHRVGRRLRHIVKRLEEELG